MNFYLLLLELAGAAALLVWAVRMVRTGVERIFGASLARTLRGGATNRLRAAVYGAVGAVALQSATAVAMLTVGFAGAGLLTLSIGLAILVGADLGSALVVRLLSFDLPWLSPLMLVIGAWFFLNGERRRTRQAGRILVGVALILLSIRLIGAATAPLRDSELVPAVVGYFHDDALTTFLLGAGFTWLMHSSVASILLVAALEGQGVIPPALAVTLMLGANLGAGLIAVGLSRNAPPEGRRLPIGNLIFRGMGAIGAVLAIRAFDPFGPVGVMPGGVDVVTLHLAFNAALVLIGLPLVPLVGRLATMLAPARGGPAGEAGTQFLRISALDRAALKTPRAALASATRELLRISEIIEIMLRPVMELYETGDPERIKQIKSLDVAVNKGHTDVKLYLAELAKQGLDRDDARRCRELMNYTINLEHAADVVAKTLLGLARARNDKQIRFSEEGWRELTNLHDRVLQNMQLALNVLVSEDRDSARQLVAEKERMRSLGLKSVDSHMERLQTGGLATQESSSLHLETVQALRQVNSLFASIAYPILQESGELLNSRLAGGDS